MLALLFADDAGGYFRSNNEFLDRYASDAHSASDHAFLSDNGHPIAEKRKTHLRSIE